MYAIAIIRYRRPFPEIEPHVDEHRALNYAARRGALFLFHLASLRKEEPRHHLWRHLRLVDHSLFKHVVSFL